MTAKSKAPKQEVKVTAPKIAKAWINVVEVSAKNEVENINAINALVTEMNNSQLSVRDIMKVIKETNRESAILKVSHVEGLRTWAEMRSQFAEFSALPLASQLAKATAAFKLLGAGNATKMKSLEIVEKEVKTARKAKAQKSKGNSTPKTKATATTAQVLESFRNFVNALDPAKLTEKERDILADVSLRLIELEEVPA